MFKTKKGKTGFHITFENGWTVSVQFGPGNYCDHYMGKTGDLDALKRSYSDPKYDNPPSKTAEIAAIEPGGGLTTLGNGDSTARYVDADDVLDFMLLTAMRPEMLKYWKPKRDSDEDE